MNISRAWATPLTAGSFILVGITGVLMFFHLDNGLNKAAHEWLSWVLLAGVVLHLVSNFRAFTLHLKSRWGRYLIGGFVIVLALTFVPVGQSGPPLIVQPANALAKAPISVLAQVAGKSTEQLLMQLEAEGFANVTEAQTLAELSKEFKPRLELMAKLLGAAEH